MAPVVLIWPLMSISPLVAVPDRDVRAVVPPTAPLKVRRLPDRLRLYAPFTVDPSVSPPPAAKVVLAVRVRGLP